MGIALEYFQINGYDISEHNGEIIFEKVKCDFLAIRVGYGKVTDLQFKRNWAAAKGRVKRIPYWYLDYYSNHLAGSSVNGMADAAWGKLQAEVCWALLKDDPEAIVFLDIENGNPKYAPPLTDATTKKRAQIIARAFLERIDQLNGKFNGIYTSVGWLPWFGAWFKDRPLWVAWYNETKTVLQVKAAVSAAGWTGALLIWQYAMDGDINDDGFSDAASVGMESKTLDLNGFIGTPSQYSELFGGPVIITPEDEIPETPPAEESAVTLWQITAEKSLFIRAQPTKQSTELGHYYPTSTPVYIDEIIDGWGHVYGQDSYICLTYAKQIK